jgi:serine/threonine protein kinase
MTGSREPKDDRPEARVGAVLADRYRLRQFVARGASGTVYLADQLPLMRPVAVKVLEASGSGEPPDRVAARFLREASTIARLEHPNAVRIYDYGTWDGRPYLVMEYVDGHSLRRLQQSGPMPAERAVAIAMQVCGALQEIHALGLVHGDLKPANILVTRYTGALDVAKVVDFGLTRGFYTGESDLSPEGQVMGTPLFMAPEQVRGEASDPRTDLYALGVVLYRSLTGESPFVAADTPALLRAHLHSPPRPFAEARPGLTLPPALEWTVRRCLEKDPNERFSSANEVLRALQVGQAALENPGWAGLVPTFRDGFVIVPPELKGWGGFESPAPGTTRRAGEAGRRAEPAASERGPSAASAPPPAPVGPSVPLWVAVVAAAVGALVGWAMRGAS